MVGTSGSPLPPCAATRVPARRGSVGRNANARRSVNATPKNFFARNTFERGRDIDFLLVGSNEGLTQKSRRIENAVAGAPCPASLTKAARRSRAAGAGRIDFNWPRASHVRV